MLRNVAITLAGVTAAGFLAAGPAAADSGGGAAGGAYGSGAYSSQNTLGGYRHFSVGGPSGVTATGAAYAHSQAGGQFDYGRYFKAVWH
ncbi:hypothetical protein A6A06_15925 [Streptomyces sp. CB02923]|uniref:hypothetical protein n=1 Tax=Streptomyces sp. CB02923 TaxID=1718985 RepID=UPI000938AFB8|nr:hypothetical protein [Streptomyces sp. CB02923]OKI02514.1 hypothetical protein A6A06_15925 [Streptomyces sp. CB02923]